MKPLTPTEDIRAARRRLAAKFNNDLQRIVADLRRQELESDAEFVTLASRPPICGTTSYTSKGGGKNNDGGSNLP